jgi:hypothetical protein
MQRRRFLRLGLGATAVLAVAGGGVAWWGPGVVGGKLGAAGRKVFAAVARGVLDGMLPTDRLARHQALQAHLSRLDATVAAFPSATQAELSRLLGLLALAPGRLALAELWVPWDEADAAQIQRALQGMRTSSLSLRQQAFHALRDLTNAAYFADPSTWTLLGYPGPVDI